MIYSVITVAVQRVFEASLAELLSPDGFVKLGLTCITGLLDAVHVDQSRHQELCELVCSLLPSDCLAAATAQPECSHRMLCRQQPTTLHSQAQE